MLFQEDTLLNNPKEIQDAAGPSTVSPVSMGDETYLDWKRRVKTSLHTGYDTASQKDPDHMDEVTIFHKAFICKCFVLSPKSALVLMGSSSRLGSGRQKTRNSQLYEITIRGQPKYLYYYP